MPTVASIAARIAREGELVILKRPGCVDLSLIGFVRGYRADELAGAIQQGDRVVIMSDAEIAAAGWPGPPKRNDQVMIRGRTTQVQSCETRAFRGADAMHVVQVRG